MFSRSQNCWVHILKDPTSGISDWFSSRLGDFFCYTLYKMYFENYIGVKVYIYIQYTFYQNFKNIRRHITYFQLRYFRLWYKLLEKCYYFVRLIQALYHNQEAIIRWNRKHTEPFHIGKGVRQGLFCRHTSSVSIQKK